MIESTFELLAHVLAYASVLAFTLWFIDSRASAEMRWWARACGVEPRWFESRRSLRRRIDERLANERRSVT